jgi:hypothetical protein
VEAARTRRKSHGRREKPRFRAPSARKPGVRPDEFAVSRPMYGKVRTHRWWAGAPAQDLHGSRALLHRFVPLPSRDTGLSVSSGAPAADGRPQPARAAHQPRGASFTCAAARGASQGKRRQPAPEAPARAAPWDQSSTPAPGQAFVIVLHSSRRCWMSAARLAASSPSRTALSPGSARRYTPEVRKKKGSGPSERVVK